MSSCDGIEPLARAVFDVLATEVTFVFACLATTDPATGLITRAFKSHPLPMGDEEFAAAEYGPPDINLFSEITMRPIPVGVLSIDTDGDPLRCRRLRDYMAPAFGFTDELRLACRSGRTTWGAVALYRGEGDPPFTAADASTVADVGSQIADGVRRALFAGRAGAPGSHDGMAVLIVDAHDRVTDMTAVAQSRIAELGGMDHGSLPANVLTATTAARRTGDAVVTHVLGTDGRWLTLRALPLGDRNGDRSVVVTIDRAEQASIGRMALEAHGLSLREQDVARLVLQGASTKDVAASLFLSPHTVQDHLKAIFRKLGVTSRREMIARLVVPESG